MAQTKIDIRELSTGTAVVISGYNRVYGGYIGKLLGKNLTIGKSFLLLEKDLPEGKIEIMLDNERIKLSKPEVNALYVEIAESNLR